VELRVGQPDGAFNAPAQTGVRVGASAANERFLSAAAEEPRFVYLLACDTGPGRQPAAARSSERSAFVTLTANANAMRTVLAEPTDRVRFLVEVAP